MLLAVVFLISSALFAQTSRGTVTGIVTDSSGSAVPAATVELKGTQTGVVRSTTTNQSGVYRFDAVDLGEHDLTVKANGFRTFANRAFNVQAAQTIGLDVRLEVGDNVSIVEVSVASRTASDGIAGTRRHDQLDTGDQPSQFRAQSRDAGDHACLA